MDLNGWKERGWGGGVVSDRGKKKKIKERGRESSDALSMMPCN